MMWDTDGFSERAKEANGTLTDTSGNSKWKNIHLSKGNFTMWNSH